MLTTGFSVAPVTSKAVPSSLFILASSVCKSLQYLTSALTQGGKGDHLFRLSRSICCREGGTLQANITGMCGECSQCLGHTEFAPSHGMCGFPVHIVQVPGCSARALSEAAPGLHALPRSKLLMFRFSGTQGTDLVGPAFCVLPRTEQLR